MTAPEGNSSVSSSPGVGAITIDELPALFECLTAYDVTFLAVSGGADSTALMHLVASWADSRPEGGRANDIRVLTVDHGLRPEARVEAEAVVAAAAKLGLPCQILTWRGDVPKTGVQQAARDLRYKLLLEHIVGEAEVGIEKCSWALVMAHHRDDLAETVLMRLGRGSGVDGLSAMQPLTTRDGVSIVRPLLDIAKARLIATLDVRRQPWHEDPSNENLDFERIRIRKAAPARAQLGLNDAVLALTARRMARARSALDEMASAMLRPRLSDPLLIRAGVFEWYWQPGELLDEIEVRVLMRVLRAIGGLDLPPRLLRVERLLHDMRRQSFSGATLANCVIAPGKSARFIIYREPGRSALPTITTDLSTPVVWDNRFEIASTKSVSPRILIRPLVREDLEMFDFEAAENTIQCPNVVLNATPVAVDDDGWLWIPALNVHRKGDNVYPKPELCCRFAVNRLV